jgi:hypothetical protein
MFGRHDERDPLERALEAAAKSTAGGWESVETLAMIAIEAKGRPEAHEFLAQALEASRGLAAGSWDSIRALSWLSRAARELAS